MSDFFPSSKQLFATLNSLKSDLEVGKYLLDVRGQGLMAAIEFARPPKDIEIDLATDGVEGCPSNFAARVGKKCIEKGSVIYTPVVYKNPGGRRPGEEYVHPPSYINPFDLTRHRRTQFTEQDEENLCNWIAAKIP